MMPWVKLDEGFYDHPKFLRVSPHAVAVAIAGLAYCNRHLTDGHIPAEALPGLRGTTAQANQLVDAGLWSQVEGGYVIHDFSDYQPARSDIQADRAAARERMRRARNVRPNGGGSS